MLGFVTQEHEHLLNLRLLEDLLNAELLPCKSVGFHYYISYNLTVIVI